MNEDDSSLDQVRENEYVILEELSPFDLDVMSSQVLPRHVAESIVRDSDGDVMYEIHG